MKYESQGDVDPKILMQSQIALAEITCSEQGWQKSLSPQCWNTCVISGKLQERHGHVETQPKDSRNEEEKHKKREHFA